MADVLLLGFSDVLIGQQHESMRDKGMIICKQTPMLNQYMQSS